MAKVRCIFNFGCPKTLTEGRVYTVQRELDKHFVIITDNARLTKVNKERFEQLN